ncbi:PREDICTED: uncharacterized protein LOC105151061 isoform X1 [Acromyrmex echinatior]|uniref:uncharacterized protein LOC105151061 isoform X1 n=2 Tax=Acromyrmex echinatior TaxID=103372 RepID=UPI000580F2F6|nr:PREDICTED: uncharacterized protein LOC105151061 isoform X1 [Acromyrmex echinatior]
MLESRLLMTSATRSMERNLACEKLPKESSRTEQNDTERTARHQMNGLSRKPYARTKQRSPSTLRERATTGSGDGGLFFQTGAITAAGMNHGIESDWYSFASTTWLLLDWLTSRITAKLGSREQ